VSRRYTRRRSPSLLSGRSISVSDARSSDPACVFEASPGVRSGPRARALSREGLHYPRRPFRPPHRQKRPLGALPAPSSSGPPYAAQIFWVEGARKRDGANHFAEHHAAFDGWLAAWPVSDQYRQIPASSFAPMRLGSREVSAASGEGIPWRRLPCSEMPARTAASRSCVNKSRPLSPPPFRYVSVVPLTGDLEFNSSPTEQSAARRPR
jgi:hypothetical protein